jgi:dihydrofolate reductase
MAKVNWFMNVVTADIAVSLDGFGAGPNQSADLPFGEGVDDRLHTWMFDHADENSDEIAAITSAGAYIMGRNMFGPVRGEWGLDWTGWWGPEPPYHAPVFVLTHYPRDPIPMDGGTTFTFVTDGPEAALEQAKNAASDGEVAIAGGPATINQYLALGAIDELRLHIVPITLGAGERILADVTGLTCDIGPVRATEHVIHMNLRPRR